MIKKAKFGMIVTIWIYLLTIIKNIPLGICQINQNITTPYNGLGGFFILLVVVIIIIALIYVMKHESEQMNKK